MLKPNTTVQPNSGVTTLEVLLTIMMFTAATAAAVDLFLSLAASIAVLLQAEQASHGPQHVIGAFAAALNRATSCAIYPDRDTFQKHPSLDGNNGNFVAIRLDDGTLLAFELEQDELRIVEDPNTSGSRERLWARGIEAPDGLCSRRNGACVLAFSAQTGATRTNFQTSGRAAFTR